MSRLSLPQAAGMPLELRRELTQLDLRLRWVSFVKGCGSLLFVALLLSAMFLGVDFFFPLSGGIRFGLLIILALTTLWLGYHWLLSPLTRKRQWPELAFLIDRSFPELQERVSSTVELSLVPEEARGIASEFMRQRLRQETDKRLSTIDLWECLSLSSMAAALAAGLLTALVASIPLLLNSGGYSLLWQRLLTPWQNLDSATNLTFVVEAGDRTIPRGDDLLIQARPEWRYVEETPPREIQLTWTDAQGKTTTRDMAYDGRLGVYIGKIAQITSPLSYHLSSRGARSRTYHVQVADRPRILDVSLTIEPPAYTNQPSTVHEGAMGTLRAIQGSRLIGRLQFEHPVSQAFWNWSTSRISRPAETDIAENATAGLPSERPTSLPATVSADGYSAVVEVVADQSDTFQFDVVSSAGLHNINEPARMIQVIADRPPRVEIAGDSEPIKVRPDEIVPLEILADDDFGVLELQVVVEYLTTGQDRPPVPDWSSAATGPTARLVVDRYELNLAPLNLKNGDILGYRAVARDGRPDPRPNEVWTPRRVLLINQEVKSLAGQDVEEFYEAMRRQAEIVRNEVAGHRKEVERQRSELDPKPREDVLSTLTEKKPAWLQQKLSLSLQLDDLSHKLQQRPITEALSRLNAEPAREMIDQAAQRLEAFEAASGQDALENIRADETALREAEGLLNRLVNQLRDAERIEQELTELQRLARRARELAQQAAQLDQTPKQPQEERKPEDNAIPEQPETAPLDQLQQEYAALSHDLDNLLSRRPELKQAAKNALLSNLSDAADLAEALAAQQAQLTESLENAQAEQRERQAPLETHLRETLDLAAELAARSEQEAARRAAPVFNADPTGQALEQQQAANQGRAEQALQQAREALARFEQTHAETPPLPADAASAARQLAEQARTLADRAEQLTSQRKSLDKEQRAAEEAARKLQQPVPREQQALREQQAQELARQQEQIAERIAGLMQATANLETPPAQKWIQPDILDSFDRAADELARRSDQASPRLKEAAKHLETLAKNLGTPEDRLKRTEQPLASIQDQAAQLAKQLREQRAKADAGEAIDPGQFEELARRQQDQAKQLLQQDTLDQEEKLVEAVESAQAASDTLKAKDLAQAIEAQQKFAEQLAQLQQALRNSAANEEPGETPPVPPAAERKTQQQAWEQADLPAELRKTRFPQRDEQTPDLSQQLERLSAQQQQLNEKTAQTLAEHTTPEQQQELRNRLSQLAGEQRQLAEQAEQLRGKQAALPRMQSQEALRDAAEALQQGQPEQAVMQQQQAARRLEQARKQLQEAQASPPAGAETPQQQPEHPPLEQLTEALARKLDELDRQFQQSSQVATPPMPEDTASRPNENGTEQSPAAAQQADASQKQPGAQTPQDNNQDHLLQALQRLRESQQRIAEQAQQLARQTETSTPDKKDLAQALNQAAQQARAATDQLESGQLQGAADQAQQARQQLTQAAEQPPASPAAQSATAQLAQQQQQLAEQIQQIADNPQAAQAARQTLQEQLNEQADRLTEALRRIANETQAKPIDDRHNGQQVGQLSQQSGQANSTMQQSLRESQQGNLQEATQDSRQASQQLRELANQSAKLADMKRDTLVPEPVGEEAAEASRQLTQARQALEQARQQADQQAPPSPSSEQGTPQSTGQPQDSSNKQATNQSTPPGQASTSPDAPSSPGTPSDQPGTPGQDPNMPDTPLQQLARELAQAAQSLQQAHQNLQPKQQSSPPKPQQSRQEESSPSGQPSESADSTAGNQSPLPADGPLTGEILKSAIMRDWGKRQGVLEADLTDSRRRAIDQEYAPLIQRYFESLAKPAEGNPQP